MRLVIVTGMSGAGKTTALKMLEDMGYFCVDNLPIPLLTRFVELFSEPEEEIKNIALGIDVRGGQDFSGLQEVLDEMDVKQVSYEILFLDAQDDVLIKRYKETRRQHPLSGSGRVDTGIAKEREKIMFLKMRATYILDTSKMLTRELKLELEKIFVKGESFCNLYITVMSFGFKYGIPQDADLVFDVRFLPNPYYIDELKEKTGNDPEVQDYVMENEKAQVFLDKLTDMVDFLIPNYILEGKNQLIIAIGCTGGKHRSVTLANALYQKLDKQENYGVRIEHRDIGKDAITKRKEREYVFFWKCKRGTIWQHQSGKTLPDSRTGGFHRIVRNDRV